MHQIVRVCNIHINVGGIKKIKYYSFRKSMNLRSLLTPQWLHYRTIHCIRALFIGSDNFLQVTDGREPRVNAGLWSGPSFVIYV